MFAERRCLFKVDGLIDNKNNFEMDTKADWQPVKCIKKRSRASEMGRVCYNTS